MNSTREHIDRDGFLCFVALFFKQLYISCKRRRVAGYIYYPLWRYLLYRPDQRAVTALSRWIYYDTVCCLSPRFQLRGCLRCVSADEFRILYAVALCVFLCILYSSLFFGRHSRNRYFSAANIIVFSFDDPVLVLDL